MVDASNIRKMSWTLLLVLIFFMALGPSNLKYFWHGYLVAALLAVFWTLYLVYVCENFTVYLTSLIIAFFSAFSFLTSSAAFLAAASLWGNESAASVVAGLAPIAITLLAYLVIASGEPSFHPFEYDGIKVQPRYEQKQNSSASYSPVLVAGATTLAASMTIKSLGLLNAAMVAMVGMQAFCIAALFHARHIIRGLRLLRMHQRTLPTPYTFMQIDEIRQARSRWWISRFCYWVKSRCKSISA